MSYFFFFSSNPIIIFNLLLSIIKPIIRIKNIQSDLSNWTPDKAIKIKKAIIKNPYPIAFKSLLLSSFIKNIGIYSLNNLTPNNSTLFTYKNQQINNHMII